MLKFASTTFRHTEQAIHDLEVEAGVVDSLTLYLTRAVSENHGIKETERLCKLLVLVLQCSSEMASEALTRNGAKLIESVIGLVSNSSAESGKESKYAERLLRRLSSIEVSLQTVASYKDVLKLLLETIGSARNEKTFIVNHALSLLAGLATHKDSKVAMIKYPGLFQAVVDLAFDSQAIESRIQSARVLSKLAWHVKNRPIMGRTPKCLEALVAMSDSTNKNLRIEAFTSIQLLSIEYENKTKLTAKAKLLQSLSDAIDTETGDKLRFQALGILSNLLSRETFKIVGSQSGLINRLASLSVSSKGSDSDSTAALAAQCIKRLATYAQVKNVFHEDLIQAIVQMANCKRKTVMQWASKALLNQSVVSSNSFYIIRDQDAMKALAYLVSCPHHEVKEPALETVVNLAEHRSNAKKLAAHESLVGALVDIIDGETKGDNPVLQRHAIIAILSLVSHRNSTKRIAKHLGLVRALSRYGISAQDTDIELKRAALHGVIILAPFL